VSYEEKKVTFTVNVSNMKLDGIAIKVLPDKTNYLIGEELDITVQK